MKKIVTAAIAGALLLTSVSVFADSASLVGKKVQGLFIVEQNGTKIADAVIIDGVAYAPVRAVSQAAGVELKVEGKKIIMNESLEPSPTPTATAISNRPTLSPEQEKENKLVSLTGQLSTLAAKIGITEIQLRDDPTNESLKQKIVDLKAQYAEMERQLAELQK